MNIRFPFYAKLMIFNILLVGGVISFITFKNVELFKDVSLDREESYQIGKIDSVAKSLDSYFSLLFSKIDMHSKALMMNNDVSAKISDEDIIYLAIGKIGEQPQFQLNPPLESGISFSDYIQIGLKKNQASEDSLEKLMASNGFALLEGEKTPMGETFMLILPFSMKNNDAVDKLFVFSVVKKQSLKNITTEDNKKIIGIYDSYGKILASSNSEFESSGSVLAMINAEVDSLVKNIPLQKYLEINNDQSDSMLLTMKKSILGINSFSLVSKKDLLAPAFYMKESSVFVIAILISFLIYFVFIFSSQFSKPIEILEDATRRVSNGDLSIHVAAQIKTRDEVKSLAIAFDDMIVGLKEREKMQNVLNKFHGSKVTEELLKKEIALGGEKKKMVILFSDIRGFTDFSEGHSSEEVVKMLNEYFEVMVSIINRHGGVVDKFIGDAIMAVWGIPQENADDCKNALKACLDMRTELHQLNDNRIERGLVPIKIGVGLHFGEAISGQIGSQERMEFTVIGDTVNTASRIEGATKGLGVDLLISESVLAHLDDTFLIQKAGNVAVQGKSEPLSLYQVDGLYVDGAPKILRTPYSHFEASIDKKSKVI